MKSRSSHPTATFPLLFIFLFALGSPLRAQLTYTPRSDEARMIDPGQGQEFTRAFFDANNFHFVQFGVYPLTVNRRKILAPSGIGQIWLIEHKSTQIRGRRYRGAFYIVKAFPSAGLARAYADKYKKQGIDCWYNPKLFDVPFTLWGITY